MTIAGFAGWYSGSDYIEHVYFRFNLMPFLKLFIGASLILSTIVEVLVVIVITALPFYVIALKYKEKKSAGQSKAPLTIMMYITAASIFVILLIFLVLLFRHG